MLTRAVLFVGLLLAAGNLSAQGQSGVIKGQLQDSVSHENLGLATITVYRSADTSVVTYRLSTPAGTFLIPNIPVNTACYAVVTYSGYAVQRIPILLNSDQKEIDLGLILLQRTEKAMEDIIVLAERPPVLVKKDTIEFNANAFKTLPSALVEDLLRKLPGVDVDKDGNITVNGKPVSRILVDGREFFGNDPKMATRNLPANIIDRVQVTADEEVLAREPNRSRLNVPQVINLKLKKSIHKGIFGKAYAGAGTHNRDEAGAILNLFRDTLQVSLLGYTNNLNRTGFSLSDIKSIGGFNRSGVSSVTMTGGGGLIVNGFSFGGTGYGIKRTTGAGVNTNYDLPKKVRLNAQYLYNRIDNDYENENSREQFLGDTTLFTDSRTVENALDQNQQGGVRIRTKIGSGGQLDYHPSLQHRYIQSQRSIRTENRNNFEGLLSVANSQVATDTRNDVQDHVLTYTYKFKKPERQFFLNANVEHSNTHIHRWLETRDTVFAGTTPLPQSNSQFRNRGQEEWKVDTRANFYEPLSSKIKLQAGLAVVTETGSDDLRTYNKGGTGIFDVYDMNWSRRVKRSFTQNWLELGITATAGKGELIVSSKLTDNHYSNRVDGDTLVHKKRFVVLPSASYEIGNFYIGYEKKIEAPALLDLQPLPDNINPLLLDYGNPALKPSEDHNIVSYYNQYVASKLLNLYGYLNIDLYHHGIIRRRYVDAKGVQITVPINAASTVVNSYTNFGVNKQYKLSSKFQLTLRGSLYGGFYRNPVIVNDRESRQSNLDASVSGGLSLNWNDLVEWNPNYSFRYGKTSYSNDQFAGFDVIAHQLENEVIVRWPKHIVWETNINYLRNVNQSGSIRAHNTLWTAAVNYLFLKDGRGQIKLSAFDLLNQNVVIDRVIRENYIESNQYLVLRRFFMLTFTYNIRGLSPGKVGGKERLLLF